METNKIKSEVERFEKFLNKGNIQFLKEKNDELFKYRIETEFKELNEAYPTIVKKMIQGDNLDYLYKMLDAKEKIEKKVVKKEDAEKILGEELAEEFLYPLVNKNK